MSAQTVKTTFVKNVKAVDPKVFADRVRRTHLACLKLDAKFDDISLYGELFTGTGNQALDLSESEEYHGQFHKADKYGTLSLHRADYLHTLSEYIDQQNLLTQVDVYDTDLNGEILGRVRGLKANPENQFHPSIIMRDSSGKLCSRAFTTMRFAFHKGNLIAIRNRAAATHKSMTRDLAMSNPE